MWTEFTEQDLRLHFGAWLRYGVFRVITRARVRARDAGFTALSAIKMMTIRA
jgi:hypothetical protein